MIELIKNIEQWGYVKDINKAGPLMQTTKTLEEVIELQQAIIKYEDEDKCNNCKYHKQSLGKYKSCHYIGLYNDDNCKHLTEIKDAIGDIFVTLVMLSIQEKEIELDLDYSGCFYKSFEESACILEYLSNVQFNIFNKNHKEVNEYVREIIGCLMSIADDYHMTLKECVEHAYNEIKDRKGKMINGLWVKESA